MDISTLAFWSAVALAGRVGAIVMLLTVAHLQVVELRTRTLLQPFKQRLFLMTAIVIATNVPICYLHYLRILGRQASEGVTSFATVSNSLGMLAFAILLFMIYQIKVKE